MFSFLIFFCQSLFYRKTRKKSSAFVKFGKNKMRKAWHASPNGTSAKLFCVYPIVFTVCAALCCVRSTAPASAGATLAAAAGATGT
jgi:hypothetical protein